MYQEKTEIVPEKTKKSHSSTWVLRVFSCSGLSSRIFVANVNNEYWSPGVFHALVPRSEHK